MKYILSLLLLFPFVVNAQIIFTIAGDGTPGYAGDGGPATASQFSSPAGIGIDIVGNIFIADGGNNRIRKITPSGIITTITGTGTAGFYGDGGPAYLAVINDPVNVGVDKAGNIYVSDRGNNRIRKIDTSGIISTFAGNGTAGYFGDGGSATSAELDNPLGLAFDSSGNVYIADDHNHRIRKVAVSGTITTVAGTGSAGYSADGIPATTAQLNYPIGLTVDGAGDLYIADEFNSRVRMVDTAGIIHTVAGTGVNGFSGESVPATAAAFSYPMFVAVDNAGNIFITDNGTNHRVRKVDAAVIVTTIGGNGTSGFSGDGRLATDAQLSVPLGVGVDANENIIFSDSDRIRKITVHFASFTSGQNTVCQDSCSGFVNTSVGILDSIRWYSSGTTLPDIHSDIINTCFSSAGNDTMKLFAYCSGAVDSMVRVINVISTPRPVLNKSPCCSVPGSYMSYQWYEAEVPTLIPGATNNTYVAGMGAWYVIVDSGGCIGRSDTAWVVEGITNIDVATQLTNLFPNPAAKELSINSNNKIHQVSITNLLGEIIFANEYNSDQLRIDVADLPGGIYFVRINGSEVRKFVKQ